MATGKTLFDAVEAELRNARAAINNAGAYIDMLKDTVKETVSSSEIEAENELKISDVHKRLEEHLKLL